MGSYKRVEADVGIHSLMLVSAVNKGQTPKRHLIETIHVAEKKTKMSEAMIVSVVNTQGQTTESDDDSNEPKAQPQVQSAELAVVKHPKPPSYPHPGAVFDGWWGLINAEEKTVALAAGRLDAHCSTVIWKYFVVSLKKTKPELLRIILYKHLSTSYKEMLFGNIPTGSKAVPRMIDGVYEELPEHALRHAFSGAKLSTEYMTKYKPAAWHWAMSSDAFKYHVVYHCLTPNRKARLLEQLKENVEWEKAFGCLWFEQRIKPLPLPVTTGNPVVDDKARTAWLQRYNAAAAEARKRNRLALNDMIRYSRFVVLR